MQKCNPLYKSIGTRIKEIRLKRNISQEKFAEKINVSNGTHVSNIERGCSGISVPKLREICKALDINADYLLFGTSPNDVETALHYYLKQLTNEQSSHLMEIIKAYIKSCGIDEI
ncbi:MAG: helix-turn-helix transcriptional regulator [Clostridia bacterium]|nr:helix-turn-helix transcriptional regulator [Lachnospiraceae bacterium]MCI9626784.1 helix-turn-helix transcriptional regulator [Clostridia bacterium]